MKTIAIFASGTGSNATKIIEHFADHPSIQIGLIVSNRAKAGFLQTAQAWKIPTLLLTKDLFYRNEEQVLSQLQSFQIDFIALSGFLWLVPAYLVEAFSGRITNIHPALLPAFGGPGMYGMHVHRAVADSDVDKTGMTIHFVNEKYDDGAIIFQDQCAVDADDTPELIQQKVLALEHRHYAKVLEKLLISSNAQPDTQRVAD